MGLVQPPRDTAARFPQDFQQRGPARSSVVQAEGVASRVEENPDSLLRLYRRQRSAGADGVLDRRVEIADPNIKVLGGVLLAGLARPSWRRPLLLVLEVKRRPAAAVR